jgi:hypothetical protein
MHLTNDFTVSRIQFDNDLNTYGTGFHFNWALLQVNE